MPNIDREYKHVTTFMQLSEFSADLTLKKQEAPDFVLQIDGKIIGIEHTEIYLDKDYPLQAKESIEDDIAKRAESYADSKGYIPTRTKILFQNVRGLKQNQREKLASDLADYVQFNMLQGSKKPFTQVRLEIDRQETNAIYSTVMPDHFGNHYFSVRAGWMKPDASEEILKAVRAKSKNVNSYLRNCDEIWLLIVADGFNPSSLLGRNSIIRPLQSLGGFHKVYFLFYANKFLVEIPALENHDKNS